MSAAILTLTANAKNSKPERKKLNGRDYLVCESVIVVPGVMQGSQGGLFYREDTVEASTPLWEGTPLTYDHAYDSQGTPISAQDETILNEQGLGFVTSPRYEKNLKVKSWFDEERLRSLDETLHRRVEAGKPVELSVGLTGRKAMLANSQVHTDGKTYVGYVEEIVPDHVAVLPYKKGACSLEDGCGINVNCRCQDAQDVEEQILNAKDKSASQKFTELMSHMMSKAKEALGLNTTGTPVTSPTTIKAHSPQGKVFANELSHDDIRIKLGIALRSKMTQDMPYCHVVEVYDDHFVFEVGYDEAYRMDYSVNKKDEVVLPKQEPVPVKRTVQYVANSQPEPPTTTQGTEPMALSAEDRKKKIQFITSHSSSWKRQGDDVILNNLTDDKLADLEKVAEKEKKAEELTKAAQEGFTDAQVAKIGEIVKAALTPPAQTQTAAPTLQPWQTSPTVAPVATAVTANEWMATAPPEIRSIIQNSLEIVNQEKTQIIEEMIANVAEADKPAHRQRLGTKPVEELRYLRDLMPTQSFVQRSYLGAAGGLVANRFNDEPDQDDFLPSTSSYEAEYKGKKSA